jgi:AsmA protein
MSRSVRILLIVFVAIIAVLATPFLIPLNTYRASLEAAASRALSREVHIKGPLHLAIFPEIGVSLSDVTIANVPGARDPAMITAGEVVVGARIVPLFSGRLEVTDLTLKKAAVHLEVAKNAATNWSFGRDASGQPADASLLNRIGFSHVNIDGGEVTYYNAVSGKSAVLSDVSLGLNMSYARTATLARPLTLYGSLTYNGEKLKIDGRLDNFGALLSGRNTGTRISIQSNIINAEFTGGFGTDGSLSGALKLGARSVRSFAAWLGHPLPPGNGFGLVALESQFAARDGVYTLYHTHLAFDSMNLNGDITVDTNPEVLTLKGGVTIDRVNINPYLAPGAHDDTVAAAAAAKSAQPDAPLALHGLKTVNADLTLVIGGLVLPQVKLDQAVVKVTLNGGVLKADMTSITAYGGTGKGSLTVDASGEVPTFRHELDIAKIKMQPFLVEMMGVNRITGIGTVKFDLTSRGETVKAIVKDLNGKGEVRIADGNISGVDLAAVGRVIQTVLTGEVLGNVTGAGAKTPFVGLGASFTIHNGIMQSDDILLDSSAVQMNGHGTVDLSARTLEFHFEPKAAKGIPMLRLADIGAPFYVKGPWDKPSYGPDVRNLAKSIAQKLGDGATMPLDVLTRPGLSLKSILGTEKRPNK